MDTHDQHIPDFLAVLQASIWQQPYYPSGQTDFDAIWQELKMHAIENLCVDTLAKADPQNHMRYLASGARNCTSWYHLMGAQQAIFAALNAAQIPCTVIKGSAAAIAYPNPTARNMGDIDLLVHPDHFRQALDQLLANGCTLHDQRNPRHTELQYNGVHIELHRHFAVLSTHERTNRVDGMLFDAVAHAQTETLEGFSFSMLPARENGIVLLEHINSHMASGLGLRQIIDWMYFTDRHLEDDFWFRSFRSAVEAAQLETLAITVTRMCQLYLGLRNDITWCKTADEKLCARLMEHTMRQGNFGRKFDRRNHGAVNVLNALDSHKNFFRLLQRHGCYNWRALEKYPWLRPFAWLYQLCRYARKALSGGKLLRTFRGALRRQKQETDLLTALQIQRKDHNLQYDQT